MITLGYIVYTLYILVYTVAEVIAITPLYVCSCVCVSVTVVRLNFLYMLINYALISYTVVKLVCVGNPSVNQSVSLSEFVCLSVSTIYLSQSVTLSVYQSIQITL